MAEITPVLLTPKPEIEIVIQESGRKIMDNARFFIEWYTRDDLGYAITIGDPAYPRSSPLHFVAHYGHTTNVHHPADRGMQIVVFDLLHEAVADGLPKKPWKLIAKLHSGDEAVNY